MAIDTKHADLQGLRIDRSAPSQEPSGWARRYIIIGIAIVAVLSVGTLAYRLLSPNLPEVEVARATAENSADVGGIVLTASGYIVPHHKINVNSKVTGRVAWIGVEKGDRVKEGQVLVRLEDDEFRAQYEQAKGAADNARAYLQELQNGSRPEEIDQAQHNLDEASATLVNDKLTLDRDRELWSGGVVSRQAFDDATAKFEADRQRVNSLEKAYRLAKIGPRAEDIARAAMETQLGQQIATLAESTSKWQASLQELTENSSRLQSQMTEIQTLQTVMQTELEALKAPQAAVLLTPPASPGAAPEAQAAVILPAGQSAAEVAPEDQPTKARKRWT